MHSNIFEFKNIELRIIETADAVDSKVAVGVKLPTGLALDSLYRDLVDLTLTRTEEGRVIASISVAVLN